MWPGATRTLASALPRPLLIRNFGIRVTMTRANKTRATIRPSFAPSWRCCVRELSHRALVKQFMPWPGYFMNVSVAEDETKVGDGARCAAPAAFSGGTLRAQGH